MQKPSLATILAKDELPQNDKIAHPHVAPIYQSSTYIYESVEKSQAVFRGEADAYIYGRWTHPNAELVEYKLEQLELHNTSIESCKALVFTSGMAAISTLFQAVLKPGDTILVQGNIYGTTVDYLLHFAAQFNIELFFEDFSDLATIAEKLATTKNIKLIYAETPSNPTIDIYDIKKISDLAKQYGAKLAIDNTFATPYFQQCLPLGADFVVYSSTKYLNGHGTGLSGALVCSDFTFAKDMIWKIRKLHGNILSPFEAWLLNNGLKTLPLRMDKHQANAMAVANFLTNHASIKKVNYAGLKSHPQHLLATKQMMGYGGVLSFELKNASFATTFLNGLKSCQLTASLGTTDTLVQQPATMSHIFMPKAQREKYGITDGLIRLSIGIENENDLINDIAQALNLA